MTQASARRGSSVAFYLGVAGAVGILALLLYFHSIHLIVYLPFLFLLACPFLHMFMHRGHGGHAGYASHDSRDSTSSSGSWTP